MNYEYLYFGHLNTDSEQFKVPNFIGLCPNPRHEREIRYEAINPLPFQDDSILKVQSEDAFERLNRATVVQVLDEVHRVLAPAGIFRLSLQDYQSPILKMRSIYDSTGNVIGDLMTGATPFYDKVNEKVLVRFTEDGEVIYGFPLTERSSSSLRVQK